MSTDRDSTALDDVIGVFNAGQEIQDTLPVTSKHNVSQCLYCLSSQPPSASSKTVRPIRPNATTHQYESQSASNPGVSTAIRTKAQGLADESQHNYIKKQIRLQYICVFAEGNSYSEWRMRTLLSEVFRPRRLSLKYCPCWLSVTSEDSRMA